MQEGAHDDILKGKGQTLAPQRAGPLNMSACPNRGLIQSTSTVHSPLCYVQWC